MWISKVDKLCTSLKNGYFMLCPPVHTFPQCIHMLWKTRRNRLSTFSQDLCTFSVPFVRPVSLACLSRFSSIFTRDTHLSTKVIHISAIHLLKVCTWKKWHNHALGKKISTFLSLLYTENVDKLCIPELWIVVLQSTGRLQSMWMPVARQM